AASLDPQEVLGRVLEACLSLTGGDGAAVWLIDPDGSVARLAASAGEPLAPPDAEWRLPPASGERLLEARAVVVEDGDADTPVPDPLRTFVDSGSAMAAPLVVGGGLGGMVAVGS